jgi:hypothetical protein
MAAPLDCRKRLLVSELLTALSIRGADARVYRAPRRWRPTAAIGVGLSVMSGRRKVVGLRPRDLGGRVPLAGRLAVARKRLRDTDG